MWIRVCEGYGYGWEREVLVFSSSPLSWLRVPVCPSCATPRIPTGYHHHDSSRLGLDCPPPPPMAPPRPTRWRTGDPGTIDGIIVSRSRVFFGQLPPCRGSRSRRTGRGHRRAVSTTATRRPETKRLRRAVGRGRYWCGRQRSWPCCDRKRCHRGRRFGLLCCAERRRTGGGVGGGADAGAGAGAGAGGREVRGSERKMGGAEGFGARGGDPSPSTWGFVVFLTSLAL